MITNIEQAREAVERWQAIEAELAALEMVLLGPDSQGVRDSHIKMAEDALLTCPALNRARGWVACDDSYADPEPQKELVKPDAG